MKKWELFDKAFEFNVYSIMLLPTIIIAPFKGGREYSIEFHFLNLHAGLLFRKRGGRQ